MALKVALIVGDNDTSYCGVKDYTQRLAAALRDRGLSAEVWAPADWGWTSACRLRNRLRSRGFDLVHLQYPSIGVRHSLLPFLFGLARIAPSTCVTVHEYSALPKAQRCCMQMFRAASRSILFTTEWERQCYNRRLGPTGAAQLTIPIASNIPCAPAGASRENIVLYFGQLRPGKGIEDFLQLARLAILRGDDLRFQVLGASLPRQAEYSRALRAGAPAQVEWIEGADAEQVAARMSRALAAYLPFPDGATWRRGSLAGTLVNGLPAISKVSALTPPDLAACLLPAGDAEEALRHLRALRQSPQLAARIGADCRSLARRYSWASIAGAHHALYEKLCTEAHRSRTPFIHIPAAEAAPSAKRIS